MDGDTDEAGDGSGSQPPPPPSPTKPPSTPSPPPAQVRRPAPTDDDDRPADHGPTTADDRPTARIAPTATPESTPTKPPQSTAAQRVDVDTAAQQTVEPARTEPGASGAEGKDAGDAEPDRKETVAAPGGHRRRPGLWFPLVVFVLLLAAAGVVGRYVIPRPAPDPGAFPTGVGPSAPPDDSGEGTEPTLPPLPTPPTRPADALGDWAEEVGAAIGVPPVAIQAYGYAQLLLQNSDPACKLAWTTLAGIGEVESFHGQADGAVLAPTGRSDPVIVGPLLDGQGGRPRVQDTDAGAFDGDPTFDRTMGPLRLTPTMWRAHASDADGDSIQDPFDIDDAGLALARLLCSASDDLSQLRGWTAAIGRYHSGSAYATSVFQEADGYGQRTKDIV